jgi:hypothetical protein
MKIHSGNETKSGVFYSPPGLNFNKLSAPGIAHDVASGPIAAKWAPEGHRQRQKPI